MFCTNPLRATHDPKVGAQAPRPPAFYGATIAALCVAPRVVSIPEVFSVSELSQSHTGPPTCFRVRELGGWNCRQSVLQADHLRYPSAVRRSFK